MSDTYHSSGSLKKHGDTTRRSIWSA